MPENELHVGPDAITLTEHFKPFSKWTDDKIRSGAAELHERPGTIRLDATRTIRREDDTVVLVPAWVELAPWE